MDLATLLRSTNVSLTLTEMMLKEGPHGEISYHGPVGADSLTGLTGNRGDPGPTGPTGCWNPSQDCAECTEYRKHLVHNASTCEICHRHHQHVTENTTTTPAQKLTVTYCGSEPTDLLTRIKSVVSDTPKVQCWGGYVLKYRGEFNSIHQSELQALQLEAERTYPARKERYDSLMERISALQEEIEEMGGYSEEIYIAEPTLNAKTPEEWYHHEYRGTLDILYPKDTPLASDIQSIVE